MRTCLLMISQQSRYMATSVIEVGAGTLHTHSLKDLKVTALCANVALATYLAETDGTLPNGKVIHGTVAVAEVWVKRAKEWKNLRYHESELKRFPYSP